MDKHSNNDSVVSERTMEIITAVLFVVFALVVMVGSIKLGAQWGSDGPQAGYFPFYISLIMLVSSSVTLYKAFINKKKKEETFVGRESFRQVMAVLIPASIFILLVQLIGIYVSSVFYIAIFMVWLGKYPLWKAAIVSLGVSVALFVLFEIWFQVPLPHGALFNPLSMVGVQ
jgi:predicted membrane channel-forming protein YqfA (hemolysin III family)